jgi:hypothetical protein
MSRAEEIMSGVGNAAQVRVGRVLTAVAAVLVGVFNVAIVIAIVIRQTSSSLTRWSRSREWLQIN